MTRRAAKSDAPPGGYTCSGILGTSTGRPIVTDLPPELAISEGEADLVFWMLDGRIHDMFRDDGE